MSLGSDIILWLKGVFPDMADGRIDYAPVDRRSRGSERHTIGVSVDPGIPRIAFGGGKMETAYTASIFVDAKLQADAEDVARTISNGLHAFSGKLLETADAVDILSALLVSSSAVPDEEESITSRRLDFDILTIEP